MMTKMYLIESAAQMAHMEEAFKKGLKVPGQTQVKAVLCDASTGKVYDNICEVSSHEFLYGPPPQKVAADSKIHGPFNDDKLIRFETKSGRAPLNVVRNECQSNHFTEAETALVERSYANHYANTPQGPSEGRGGRG